MSYHFIKKNY